MDIKKTWRYIVYSLKNKQDQERYYCALCYRHRLDHDNVEDCALIALVDLALTKKSKSKKVDSKKPMRS